VALPVVREAEMTPWRWMMVGAGVLLGLGTMLGSLAVLFWLGLTEDRGYLAYIDGWLSAFVAALIVWSLHDIHNAMSRIGEYHES